MANCEGDSCRIDAIVTIDARVKSFFQKTYEKKQTSSQTTKLQWLLVKKTAKYAV